MRKVLLISDEELFYPESILNRDQVDYLSAYGFEKIIKAHYPFYEIGYYKDFGDFEAKEAFEEAFDEIY